MRRWVMLVLLVMAAAVAVNCAISRGGTYHNVSAGETLWSISRAYNSSPAEILKHNRIYDPDHLIVGQVVFIPGASAGQSGAGSDRNSGSANGRPIPREALPSMTLVWPVRGEVLQEFGKRGATMNNGINIAAATGTPVRAAAAGEVVYCGEIQGLGNVVIIDHGREYMTIYSHLQSFQVEKSRRVTSGETIATVGNSGRVTVPQLHFEIRYKSDARDPRQFLR